MKWQIDDPGAPEAKAMSPRVERQPVPAAPDVPIEVLAHRRVAPSLQTTLGAAAAVPGPRR